VQIGLSMADLDTLTLGMVYDLFAEKANDSYEWEDEATLEDIENF
jgi:hypothetical protein